MQIREKIFFFKLDYVTVDKVFLSSKYIIACFNYMQSEKKVKKKGVNH